MKIGVNSKEYQRTNTGIQYYIKLLYKKCLEIDQGNKYLFYQTDDNKTIGKTRVSRFLPKQLRDALFDIVTVNFAARKDGVDVLHGPAYFLPFFRLSGMKYIVTVHDLSFKYFPENHTGLFNLFIKLFFKRSLVNADIIVADSESTKKDIIQFYNIPAKKIKVVYLGVDDSYFNPPQSNRLIKQKYFLSVTTHPQRKNITAVLEVLAQNKKLTGYTYVIAGLIDKTQQQALLEKIAALKIKERVVLYGYAPDTDLISLYTHAEFFIYPSFYEGFGFPVLEAMISHCPVITANNSSLIELMPDKRWLVNPKNNDDISEKINNLLSLPVDQRKKSIEKNYEFAKQFRWEKTAQEMIALFQSLTS